jgi:hypothetical protein
MIPLSLERYMVFHPGDPGIVKASAPPVPAPGLGLSSTDGHEVSSYRILLQKVAALSYYNSRFRILFRGQSKDYTMNHKGEEIGRSSLYPSILRSSGPTDRKAELSRRFAVLSDAEEKLKSCLSLGELHRDQILRWAILQHYEVVATPLIDLTQSLQTALSFALFENRDEAYIFALAFPQLTSLISVSIESMTQVIDFTQVCPPEALRPHFQSGVLAGDYPIGDRIEATHGRKGLVGNKFACRLLSKFKLKNCRSWASEGFTPTPSDLLYPNSYDPWFAEINAIKGQLK